MADKRTELSEIKRMGGKPQKNSGRGLYAKGDASLADFIVDVKEYKQTFGLSRSVWAKISTDAARHRKDPALMICLGEGSETLRLWVIGDTKFKLMLEAYKEKYGELDE